MPYLHISAKELPPSLCPSALCQGLSPAPTAHVLAKLRLCTVNNWNQPTYSPPGQALIRTLKPHQGITQTQCQITEFRAWLTLCFLPREVYWEEPEMEEQIQRGKGDRGIGLGARGTEGPSPWQHSLSQREEQSVSSLQQPQFPVSTAVLLVRPAPSGTSTLWGSRLAGLVKNTAGSKNKTEAAAQRVLLSLSSRSTRH